MSVGDDAKAGVNSYLAIQRESTWGSLQHSGATNATAIEFLGCTFRTEIKSEKLDTFGFRGMTKSVPLERMVQGSLEHFLHPEESPLIFAVAMGGGIISTSLTGAYTHSISVGNISDTAPTAISVNHKKGDHVFNYVGGRVDTLKLTANVGEVARASYDMVFKDSTIGATNIGSSLSYSAAMPFTFVQGVFRYQATEAAVQTTTAAESVLGVELTLKNNLKSDGDARKLGSALLAVLPATRREVELKVKMRFDTTTTYDRFIQGTPGSVELIFTGNTITADKNYSCRIILPKVINRSGDTEVTESNGILTTEITYDCLLDTTTAAGRELGVTFINNVGSYTAI